MRLIMATTLALTPLLAADDEPAKRLNDAAVVFSEVMERRIRVFLKVSSRKRTAS